MGKAEDLFKKRRAEAEAVSQDWQDKQQQQTITTIETLIPKVVSNLERLNYPEGKYPFTQTALITVNGERRAAWQLARGDYDTRIGCSTFSVYILTDGSLVTNNGEKVCPADLHNHYWRDNLIEQLQAMANFKP